MINIYDSLTYFLRLKFKIIYELYLNDEYLRAQLHITKKMIKKKERHLVEIIDQIKHNLSNEMIL